MAQPASSVLLAIVVLTSLALATSPTKMALSNLVASLKGVSSRLLRQQFGAFHPWLKRRGVLWSPSYFASSCGGAPIDILRQYIEEQQTPH